MIKGKHKHYAKMHEPKYKDEARKNKWEALVGLRELLKTNDVDGFLAQVRQRQPDLTEDDLELEREMFRHIRREYLAGRGRLCE